MNNTSDKLFYQISTMDRKVVQILILQSHTKVIDSFHCIGPINITT